MAEKRWGSGILVSIFCGSVQDSAFQMRNGHRPMLKTPQNLTEECCWSWKLPFGGSFHLTQVLYRILESSVKWASLARVWYNLMMKVSWSVVSGWMRASFFVERSSFTTGSSSGFFLSALLCRLLKNNKSTQICTFSDRHLFPEYVMASSTRISAPRSISFLNTLVTNFEPESDSGEDFRLLAFTI